MQVHGEGRGSPPTVSYGEQWSSVSLEIVDPLDPQTARRRHERGVRYTAILGDPEHPWAFLEVRLEVPCIDVNFLDQELREDLGYTFGRAPDSEGGLFLEQATWTFYGSSSGEVEYEEIYVFEAPDLAQLTRCDYVTDEEESFLGHADLAENREPVPAFGDYASIARRER